MDVFPDRTLSAIVMPFPVVSGADCSQTIVGTVSDVIWQLREYVAPATAAPEAWIFTGSGSVVCIKKLRLLRDFLEPLINQDVTYRSH